MKGVHEVKVSNVRLQYKLSVCRNITILRGDSATGKTTLIDMILSYQVNGKSSGVTVECDKPCVVLTALNWQSNLAATRSSIVFIDEGCEFVLTREFAQAVKNSDNYYVIATRSSLFGLPYSIKEIYGIKNKSGNRYQGTKRLYSEFYPLYNSALDTIAGPECVIVEDTNSGYEFFSAYFGRYQIPCVSAGGKSNLYKEIVASPYRTLLVIADGAAFGPEMERIVSLRKRKDLILYLPESFEWLVLKADLLKDKEVKTILDTPAEFIESSRYFSWERFFTELLTERSAGTYLQYGKSKLNPVYLQKHEMEQVAANMPEWASLQENG